MVEQERHGNGRADARDDRHEHDVRRAVLRRPFRRRRRVEDANVGHDAGLRERRLLVFVLQHRVQRSTRFDLTPQTRFLRRSRWNRAQLLRGGLHLRVQRELALLHLRDQPGGQARNGLRPELFDLRLEVTDVLVVFGVDALRRGERRLLRGEVGQRRLQFRRRTGLHGGHRPQRARVELSPLNRRERRLKREPVALNVVGLVLLAEEALEHRIARALASRARRGVLRRQRDRLHPKVLERGFGVRELFFRRRELL